MVINVKYTHCVDAFAVYTSIKSLFCTPEANRILCQLYLNFKNQKYKKN